MSASTLSSSEFLFLLSLVSDDVTHDHYCRMEDVSHNVIQNIFPTLSVESVRGAVTSVMSAGVPGQTSVSHVMVSAILTLVTVS